VTPRNKEQRHSKPSRWTDEDIRQQKERRTKDKKAREQRVKDARERSERKARKAEMDRISRDCPEQLYQERQKADRDHIAKYNDFRSNYGSAYETYTDTQ